MTRTAALLSLVASLLGVLFASNSTLDYANHLDRKLHDIHCSFVPGTPVTDQADACRAAMYSPFSALLKEKYWGGVPISLFAVGAFGFFVAFSLYLLLAGQRAPRRAVVFAAVAGTTPLVASAVMFVISATQIGSFCKTCVGIYGASLLLAIGGLLGLRSGRFAAATAALGAPHERPPRGVVELPWAYAMAWLVGLGVATLAPAVAYVSAMPDHRPFLGKCGSLPKAADPAGVLLEMETPRSTTAVILFEDPLCPTCQAFHQRMLVEDMFDKLRVALVLFPLDSECNWMLGEPLHPGACLMSRAVLCGGQRARQVLEWAYDEQETLAAAGKRGPEQLRAAILARWGSDLLACTDKKETKQRLNKHLHYAADNSVPISTPQMYLGPKRFCDEDTDIGLRYTMAHVAPEVLR